MKKTIMCMFVLCMSLAFADEATLRYAVYNFKAVFKRIEPVLTVQNANGVNPRHLSYKPVSDTLKGYLVVPDCCSGNGCVACGESNPFGCDDEGESISYLYIIRGQEREEKDALIKVKASEIFGTVFGQGANSAYIGTNKEDAVFQKLTKASLTMLCEFPEGMFPTRFYKTSMSTNGMRELDYGMLGLTCLDGYMVFTGYGTATPIVKTTVDISFCTETTSSTKCIRISTINGTLTGMFNYGNNALCDVCDEFGITDPCQYYLGVYKSPVTGTWMLKYSSALSSHGFKNLEDLESYILKNMKKKEVVDAEVE